MKARDMDETYARAQEPVLRRATLLADQIAERNAQGAQSSADLHLHRLGRDLHDLRDLRITQAMLSSQQKRFTASRRQGVDGALHRARGVLCAQSRVGCLGR